MPASLLARLPPQDAGHRARAPKPLASVWPEHFSNWCWCAAARQGTGTGQGTGARGWGEVEARWGIATRAARGGIRSLLMCPVGLHLGFVFKKTTTIVPYFSLYLL